jgi:Domain of unknown function (DUF4276)
MVEMRLYVEGGGDSKLLRIACRHGFSEFLRKAGLKSRMPRIVACGGRDQAYRDFCTALKQGANAAMLLVDSEDAVEVSSPWTHLGQRPGDRWVAPRDSTDDDCHPMVQCMESGLLTDRETLTAFFGQGFNATALPDPRSDIESKSKSSIYESLLRATRDCKTKARYSKGEHSFDLLARIDPKKVIAGSRWAARFVTVLDKRMAC